MKTLIAIDGSRAFLKRRTGIEEYAYQVIRHLRDELQNTRVILYIRADQEVDFAIPENWTVKKLWAPRFWTQIRLSLQLLWDRPEVLFVPAHTVPLIHPRHTAVTVHGLEYEFCPGAYSLWARWYMRTSIRFSCRVAERIIAVSKNTKRDIIQLYGVRAEKIEVVYEGYEDAGRRQKAESSQYLGGSREKEKTQKPYFLFIGRLEERKNIERFIEAFELLKEKYQVPHEFVLAGKPGYGYEKIQASLAQSKYREDIQEIGYVSEEEKWKWLQGAEAFVFATLYEGFGIPVLEAQSLGVAVVTSKVSSLPEVAGNGAVLVDPEDVHDIAESLWRLVSDKDLKNGIIQKGLENVKRFSWEKCAREIGDILKGEK
jgi:glycosyltransferase involved in cell wall biosynthesis